MKQANKAATVKIVLDTRYEKTGSLYPVKLRVTYDRKQKYFGTKYSMTIGNYNKMTGNRPGDLKDILFDLQEMERKADAIIKKLPVFSFELFEKKYLNAFDEGSLLGAYQSYMKELEENDQPGTAYNYQCAINSLESFQKGLKLQDITPELLRRYEKFMEGKSPTTVSMYLRTLRTIINKAIAANDFPKEAYPFGRYKYQPPQAKGKKQALSIEVIASLYQYEGSYQRGKDFWFFQYFANGLNMKDVCRLKYSNIDTENDMITFKRAKTSKTDKEVEEIQVDYIGDLKRIVKMYGNEGGPDDYIFPVLSKGLTAKRERELITQFIHVINSDLKKISKELGIKKFTTQSSRHSFATVQRDSNLPIAQISKMLGHKNIKTTMNYMDALDKKTIKIASKNLTAFKSAAKVVNL